MVGCGMLKCKKSEQDLINEAIERDIKQQQREAHRIYKILLLGTGGCGKSTFLKQMRLIESEVSQSQNESGEKDPFPEDERKTVWRPIIYQNIYTGITTLVTQMEKLRIKYGSEDNKRRGDAIKEIATVLEFMTSDQQTIRTDYALKVQNLWEDSGIQKCFDRRAEYQLEDSVHYFLNNLLEVLKDGYVPSIDHVLHARVMTKTIYTQDFPMPNKTTLRMIDVGGQRGYRDKWIHYFDNVVSVIFITSLSEFDLRLEEDETVFRTEESLNLFRNILKLPFFINTTIILFLNKTDLLKDKLRKGVSFEEYFPEFDPDDFEDDKRYGPEPFKEAEYMKQLYLECDERDEEEKRDSDRSIYSHLTCATNTDSIKVVWKVVKGIILENAMRVIALT